MFQLIQIKTFDKNHVTIPVFSILASISRFFLQHYVVKRTYDNCIRTVTANFELCRSYKWCYSIYNSCILQFSRHFILRFFCIL